MLESVHLNANQIETWSNDGQIPKKNSQKSRAQIYLKRENIGPKLINSIVYAKNLLQLKGIFENEIEEIVLEENEDAQANQILEQIGGISSRKDFPVIFINEIPIGTIGDLEESIISSKIDSLLEQQAQISNKEQIAEKVKTFKEQKQMLEMEMKIAHQNSRTDVVAELRKSIDQLDHDLNHITSLLHARSNPSKISQSSMLSSSPPRSSILNNSSKDNQIATQEAGLVEMGMWYVGTAINSFANYFNKSQTTDQPSNLKEMKDEKGVHYVEFEVIQVNWYWRQQKRILRFSHDKMFRLNPFTKDLRAVHKYSNIQKITITGTTFMTITFSDGNQPEYYQSGDMETIVKVIANKSRPAANIQISFVKETN